MKTKNMVTVGILVAALEAVKFSLSAIPGVELVSLFIILYTINFRKLILYVIYTFVLLEGLMYGFGIWWVMYLYIWTLLAGAAYLCRKNRSVILWGMIAGVYGMLFGALCAIPYLFTSGFQAAIAYWVAGIPYDIAHGIANFFVTLLLFSPLNQVLKKINRIIYE